jgi:hypothetical protein
MGGVDEQGSQFKQQEGVVSWLKSFTFIAVWSIISRCRSPFAPPINARRAAGPCPTSPVVPGHEGRRIKIVTIKEIFHHPLALETRRHRENEENVAGFLIPEYQNENSRHGSME